jgi:ligand-binding sensor domain-containing protein/signal transduction histidine kinase
MNKQIAIILLLAPLLLFTVKVDAKAILLNEERGLGNLEVNTIAKDKEGMMWIGTKRGLSKYDGYNFTPIVYFDKLTIHALVYDSARHVIWVGTDKGLQYISCKDGEVFQCTPLSETNPVVCLSFYQSNLIVGFQYHYILQIAQDRTCKVLYRFKKGILWTHRMQVDQLGNVYMYLTDSDQIIKWVAQAHQVVYLSNWETRPITFLALISDQLYLGGFDRGIENITHSNSSGIYFDSLNAIKQDPEFVLDSKSSVLIAYRNSTKIIEVNKKTGKAINVCALDEEVFSHKRIYCLYKDEFNIIWVGTNKGLIKLIQDKPKPVFEKLLYSEPGMVSTRQIIEDGNGDIYVASYAGFLKYDKRKRKWIKHDKIAYQGKMKIFSSRSLLNMDTNFMFMGSDARHFVRYNKQSQSLERLSYQSGDGMCNTDGSTLALAKDIDGIIWIGSEYGLLSFDPKNMKLTCHTNDKYSVGGVAIRCIYMLADKIQFWVGTNRGAYLVNKYKGTLFSIDEHTTPSLNGTLVNAITTDHKGNVWIGTDVGGVNVLSSDFKDIYTITKKDGLSNNEVYGLLWQDSVRLWISTYNGLNYYQAQTQTIIQYFKTDGITDNEFNQNSSFRANDGKLYFGGINGITAFYPPLMKTHERPYKIFTSSINKLEKKSGKIVNVLVADDHQIAMYPGDNLLTFSFAVTDYTQPEFYSYFYKIEGQHPDWISLGTQSTLRLESLKSGKYKLFVKATKGSRGASSTNVLTYDLAVQQVFYRAIWFYFLLAIMFGVLIFFYFSNRLNSQRKLELLRIKIASDLHDEVGSLLTRITMSADRLVTRMSRDSETREKLEGVSALSREANVAMSDVLWTIDSRNDFMGNLTDRMREHAEDLLFPRGINLSIDFGEIDQQRKLSPEFRQHLFLLYKELIHNIVKHSRAMNVEINYKQAKEECVLSVKNDGVLSSEDAVHKGQGLSNITMRAKMLNGYAMFNKEGDYFEVTIRL